MDSERLLTLARGIRQCRKCPLAEGRTHAVPGEGDCRRGIMLIGEAPGEKEDLEGRPFWGRTGNFLDKVFADLDIERSDFFITSSVKCRPPKNRNPHAGELDTCRENWLLPQIQAVKPSRIVLLGLVAARSLLGERAKGVSLADLRGSGHEISLENVGVFPCIATCHPTAAMRFPRMEQALREDLSTLI